MRLRYSWVLLLPLSLAMTACTGPAGSGPLGVTAKGKLFREDQRRAADAVNGKELDGSSFSLQSTAGQVTLLNLYASWCPPCQAETPQLVALYPEEKAAGVAFVGVDTKDLDKSAALDYTRDARIPYPVIYDPNAKLPIEIGRFPLPGLPMTILLDKKHRIVAVYSGPVLPADLRPALATLRAET
ncbi:Thiol-disulfide isomerase or thioredoxin [Frankineae bacterium MT45]|nr:Thiol-disulfide isomerase or thioredoxin [Frankineae bacterium MT45]